MKLANQYNRVNLFTSLMVLLITGIIYYVVIHFILTNKLDKDLTVEENEIQQYVKTYQKLPLPASYMDQQVYYSALKANTHKTRAYKYTTYYNSKEKKTEPGRSLVTIIHLKGEPYQVIITKSRVEAEDLLRIILVITLGVTGLLLLSMMLINRFVLIRLWKPFYAILNQMKTFNLVKMNNIVYNHTQIDEFNELNASAGTMAASVQQDYKELKNFTDNASHEMMTPLAVINSKLDTLLQTGTFTEQQGMLFEDIYYAIGRLSRLNQSLLLLAKIENNLLPDVQDINLKDTLNEKIRQFRELFEKDNLILYQEMVPAKISMSRYLVDILLNNLFSNAIRYNYTGGSIWICLQPKALQIINTGKSGKLDMQHFDRFFKSPSSEGMGLGLAIVKQICILYGYSIDYAFKDEKHHFTILFEK